VLGIHHVRSGPHQTAWDLAFLALGAILLAGGWLLQRRAAFTDATGQRAVR
jgi:MYXO-CTERM domain-containing protein